MNQGDKVNLFLVQRNTESAVVKFSRGGTAGVRAWKCAKKSPHESPQLNGAWSQKWDFASGETKPGNEIGIGKRLRGKRRIKKETPPSLSLMLLGI